MPELRQLRYFLAVAERRSFSRAALDLHLSQSAISESVRKLERELGVTLLVRSSRQVSLTPAGEALMHEGADALARFDVAIERARAAQLGTAGRLRIGFEAAGAGPVGTLARKRFAERFPDVRVEPRRFDWGGEAAALRDGECDVAFVWLPNDTTGLRLQVVSEEPRYAGLKRGHPLAGRESIGVDELNTEPIMWTRLAPRVWVDWWAVNPRPDGSEPAWGPVNDNVEEMLEGVAAGAGYCIAPRSMTEFYGRPDIAWVPISDVEPLRIALAWRTGETAPLVAAFADLTLQSVET